MSLTAMALAHLRRYLGKSVLMVTGLAIAVAAFVAVLSLILSLQSTMDDRLARFGANLTVTSKDPRLTLSYGGVAVATAGTAQPALLDGDAVAEIRAIPSAGELAAVIPVLLKPVTVGGEQYLAIGTDVEGSARIKPWWRVEGLLPAAPDQVLLGLNARNKLAVEPGDQVRIGDRTFFVSGVLWATGGEEDNAVILDLAELARLTASNAGLNLVEITAVESSRVDQIATEIEAALPDATVATVKRSLQFNAQAGAALSKIGVASSVLIAAVAVFVVALTMLAAVRERQKEIGVLRAVGFRRGHILQLMFKESLLVSLVAAVFGLGLGVAGAALAPRLAPGLTLDFAVDALVLAGGVALSVVLGTLATVYPAFLAARLDPTLALKRL
jgi:putative ABC transport system permease protein